MANLFKVELANGTVYHVVCDGWGQAVSYAENEMRAYMNNGNSSPAMKVEMIATTGIVSKKLIVGLIK